jgi:hypothetical protein
MTIGSNTAVKAAPSGRFKLAKSAMLRPNTSVKRDWPSVASIELCGSRAPAHLWGALRPARYLKR